MGKTFNTIQNREQILLQNSHLDEYERLRELEQNQFLMELLQLEQLENGTSQQINQPRNRTNENARQYLSAKFSESRDQTVNVCQFQNQQQLRIPFQMPDGKQTVQVFQRSMKSGNQIEQNLHASSFVEQVHNVILCQDENRILLDQSRQSLQIQNDAHAHIINAKSFEEQLNFGSVGGFSKQTQSRERILTDELFQDRFQFDSIPEFRFPEFQKPTQFSEQGFWKGNFLKSKQTEQIDYFNADVQHFSLLEWMQYLMPSMQSNVEQDLIYMQSQFETATWLLIACAATTLNLKESSKTPGGFGSCQAEMVHVVQAKTMQTIALS